MPCALPCLLEYLFIPMAHRGAWSQRKPETHQKGKGFGNPALPTSPSPVAPFRSRQVCSQPSCTSVASVLNRHLFISRPSSSAVMAGEGECEPTRERGPQSQKIKNKKKKQPAINIINLSESQAPNSSEFAASLKHLS